MLNASLKIGRGFSRRTWVVLVIWVLMLPFAVGSTLAGSKPVRSLLEMRRDKVVIQEWDLSCGAAALATILNYQHGDRVSERTVARALMKREVYIATPGLLQQRQGFSLLDLKRFVDQRGYEGVGFGQLEFEDLVLNAPIMVPVNFAGYNHFVVFRGHRGNRVLLADPAFGNRTMRVDRFMESWLRYPSFGRVGFIVKRLDGANSVHDLQVRPDDFVMLR